MQQIQLNALKMDNTYNDELDRDLDIELMDEIEPLNSERYDEFWDMMEK